MAKKIILTAAIIVVTLYGSLTLAANEVSERLSGRILLQVEAHGEAWYMNPDNAQRYFLGRPADAFTLMRELGIGITNNDLEKIPVGIAEQIGEQKDTDGDGLCDVLESALGTDIEKEDTDSDGYGDALEVRNDYNPLGLGEIAKPKEFTKKNSGKIFLAVEKKGEAWYLDPVSAKRYFLGSPKDAFMLMRFLGLGISNENINKINAYQLPQTSTSNDVITIPITSTESSSPDLISASATMAGAANAIRKNDKTEVVKYFIPEMKKALEYTLDFLDADGRLTLGNILSGSKETSTSNTRATYSNEVYFSLGGYKVPLNFYVEKQDNGDWLITNL